MAEDANAPSAAAGQPPARDTRPAPDPGFVACVNEDLRHLNAQANQHGVETTNVAAMYAIARYCAHVFLLQAAPGSDVSAHRASFLDYTTTTFRKMLNEHLDGLGHERGIAVGRSELEEAYAQIGQRPDGKAPAATPAQGQAVTPAETPAGQYVAAAGAVPPPDEA